MRGIKSIDMLFKDLRYGVRMLLKHKGFTAVALLSLALGIGVNTAIFSLMDAVLLKMLPVKDPAKLIFLEQEKPLGPRRASELSYSFFERLREQHDVLEGVSAFTGSLRTNVAMNGQGEVAEAQQVSGSFFGVLGINALLGRTITDDDDRTPGGHPVAVISYRYWQNRWGRDPGIVGKTVVLNGYPFTIIGVTPPEFFGVTVGEAPDLWVPMMMYAQLRPGRAIEEYFNSPLEYVLARRKSEVTEQQVRTSLTGLLRQILLAESGSELSPERQLALNRQSIAVISASEGLSRLRAQFSEPLRLLIAAVALILLIACANVANLLLARAAARQKEIAIRLALGASRARLIRQLFTESVLLAVIGGACGLLFAWWGSSSLLALVRSGRNPVFLKLSLDMRMLGFTAATALLASILFGLVPAWRATRVDLHPTLKDMESTSSGTRLGLGKMLVVVQVALSLVLLICAGLFMRSLAKLQHLDAGIDRENVLLVSTDPRLIGYQGKQIALLYQRLLDRFKTLPGVRSASLSRQGLLSEGMTMNLGSLRIQGRPAPPNESPIEQGGQQGLFNRPVLSQTGPEYFETVGMAILRGRGITAQDNETAPKVAVVNETFACQYFGREDPIGHRFGFSSESSGQIEIVGVVRDAKYNSLREPARATYYLPYLQDSTSWRETTFQLRTVAQPTQIIAAVGRAAREVDANLPLYNIKTLEMQVNESLVQERLIGLLASFFGLLSLSLAAIGLHGIMAYAVSRRSREIGIRMALGARRSVVLRMILQNGMKLVAIGVGLGLAVSLAATRVIASQLFGITATDPLTFVAVPLLLLIVTLLACFVPARRATKVDPLITLRQE